MNGNAQQSAAGVATTEVLRDDMVHLLGGLGDGVIVLDRQWRITYANDEARRISRIKPEDLNGPNHWDLYPDSVGMEVETVYRRSMAERISLECEFYYPPLEAWLSLRTLPVPSGIAVHYRDLTRLRQAERTRDDGARQLQQVLDTTSDGIFLLDRDFRITFLNRRGRELLAPSGEVLGRTMWEAFPYTASGDSPFAPLYRQAIKRGVAGRVEGYYPEPLNSWFTLEVYPSEGGVIAFFRDTTEERAAAEELRRKTAEAERQASEIETMYRTAPIGLALFDTEDFRYLRLNDRQAAFFGLKPEQVVGKTLTEMAPIPGLRELFEQVKAGRPVVNHLLEGELSSHPGEHRYWTVNYFPVYGADDTIQGIAAASLEITAQRRAEQALIESEKLAAVGRLAASISHEINNPLESITNLLYLISGSEELMPETKGWVDLAQDEIARVSQIATQTLRFHRQTAQRTRVTAAQLCLPVLNLYQGRLTNSGISVDTNFAGESPVLCQENEIRQVLNNLIANAIDASREGGTLTVGSKDRTNAAGLAGVEISVADTGHGMPEAVQERIFEPFFTTKDLNGTGLGLWISADIVERHHGELTVESSEDAVEHGTVFRLWLPVG